VRKTLHLLTARYSNPFLAGSGLVSVGITRYPPRFPLAYELKANLYDLAPSASLLARAKKGLPREEFLQEYEHHLDRVGLQNILRQLAALQGDACGLVLLCYEDLRSGESCHRTILADWLKRVGGITAMELIDPGDKGERKKVALDRRGELQ
jgi:uncharacterized protein YeaO (DUF488 family)